MEKPFSFDCNIEMVWVPLRPEPGLLLWCHLVDRTWWCISITLLIVFGSCSSSLSLNINEQTRPNNLHVKDWICIQLVLLCRKEREKVRKRNCYKKCKWVTNTNTFLGWLNLQSSDISPSFCHSTPSHYVWFNPSPFLRLMCHFLFLPPVLGFIFPAPLSAHLY